MGKLYTVLAVPLICMPAMVQYQLFQHNYFSNALVYYLSFSKLHASIICQGIVCVGVVCSKTSRFSIAVIIMHC